MAINHNQYLFQNRSGLWVFQIFVPKYMRHVFGHKRARRKSTGTKDIVKARQFRNHLLIEFNKLKEQLKPDTEEKRISGAIASLYQEVSANNEIEDRRGKPAEVKTTSPPFVRSAMSTAKTTKPSLLLHSTQISPRRGGLSCHHPGN